MQFWLLLVSLGETALSLFLWAVLIPFAPFFLLLLVFRLAVTFLAKLVRPDLIPIYTVTDHLLSVAPSNSHQNMNFSSTWLLKEKLDAMAFRNHFENAFLSTQELKERYINLYCYFVQWCFYIWKKSVAEINLEDRIKEISLSVNSLSDIEEFVGEYTDYHDYGENPNWEILVINNTELKINNTTDENYSPGSILVMKFHHGLCDGYSMIHIIDKLCGTKSPYIVKESTTSFSDKVSYKLFH